MMVVVKMVMMMVVGVMMVMTMVVGVMMMVMMVVVVVVTIATFIHCPQQLLELGIVWDFSSSCLP